MRRGEVRWRHGPGAKPRPVCVLTRDEAIPVLSAVLVAPATSTKRGLVTEVGLDQTDGMPKACVLTLDNVEVVPKSWLSEPIARLSPARMHEVCEALRFATACA